MAKEKIEIKLILSELIYDIQNRTHKTGEVAATGENGVAVSHMQVSDDEDIRNAVLRKIESATATLLQLLQKYTDNKLTHTDDILRDDTSNIVIVLNMPANYHKAMTDRVVKAAHDYIVNSVIGDWFAVTNPERAAEYITTAAANSEELIQSINTRVRPQRPI